MRRRFTLHDLVRDKKTCQPDPKPFPSARGICQYAICKYGNVRYPIHAMTWDMDEDPRELEEVKRYQKLTGWKPQQTYWKRRL